MTVIYNREKIPPTKYSIFLAGPTSRDDTPSWRPEAVKEIKDKFKGEDVSIILPEHRTGKCEVLDQPDYRAQIDWEQDSLDECSLVLMWVPRDLDKLPGFTTNVEFGMLLHKDKLLYGRPDNSKKNLYLDYSYLKLNPNSVNGVIKQIPNSLKDIVSIAYDKLVSVAYLKPVTNRLTQQIY